MGRHQLTSLIKMANQVAANNTHIDDETERARIVASHLRKFWARSMKQLISQHVAQGGEGLSPIAKSAILEI